MTYQTGPSGTEVITATYDGDSVEATATQPVTLVVSQPNTSSQISATELALVAAGVGIIGLAAGAVLALKLNRGRRAASPNAP